MKARIANKIFNSVLRQFFSKRSKLIYSSRQKRESLKIHSRKIKQRTNNVQEIDVCGVKIIVSPRRLGKI